jgi:hypothetical protein
MTDNNLNGNKVTQSIALKGTATPAAATVGLGGLSRTYTGNPIAVSATTSPSSLRVNVTYNGKSTPPIGAGTYAVKAVVADPAYSGTASGTLVISKSTPNIIWIAPKPITHGTALGRAQLNASSNVLGRFTYSPGAGSIPGKGHRTLTAVFTPADLSNFNSTTASVVLVVR